jgi:hypothetical protein
MGNIADIAAGMFNQVVDTQYPAMQEQRAAMLSGVKLPSDIKSSGEQFTGAQAVASVIQDGPTRTV